MLFKSCTRCEEELPATKEHFYKKDGGKYGLYSRCKKCIQAIAEANYEREAKRKREWYLNNKEKAASYSREHYQKNRSEYLERFRVYRQNNPEIIKQGQKAWYEKNKETAKQRSKERYEENKEEILEKMKEYRKRNAGRIKAYFKEYDKSPERMEYNRTAKAKRKAVVRNLPSTLTHEQWMSCLVYFNGQCAYCGGEEELQQEHVVPVSRGGGLTPCNIIPACSSCNNSKKDKDFSEWYSKQESYNKDRERRIVKYLQKHS